RQRVSDELRFACAQEHEAREEPRPRHEPQAIAASLLHGVREVARPRQRAADHDRDVIPPAAPRVALRGGEVALEMPLDEVVVQVTRMRPLHRHVPRQRDEDRDRARDRKEDCEATDRFRRVRGEARAEDAGEDDAHEPLREDRQAERDAGEKRAVHVPPKGGSYRFGFGGSYRFGFGGGYRFGFGGSYRFGFGGSWRFGFGGSWRFGFGRSCGFGFGGI